MKDKKNIEVFATTLDCKQKILAVKVFYLSVSLMVAFGVPLFCYAFLVGSVVMASLGMRDFTEAEAMISTLWILIGVFAVCVFAITLFFKLKYPFYSEKLYHYIKRSTAKMDEGDAKMKLDRVRTGKRLWRTKLAVGTLSTLVLLALYCVIFLRSIKLDIASPTFSAEFDLNVLLMIVFASLFEVTLFFFTYIRMKYPLYFGSEYLCIE